MSSLSLIVKATRLCNLRCSYCHDWRAGPDQAMSFEVMARMTAAALRDAPYEDVHFIWHGGETTVLPIDFYEKAIFVQSRFRQSRQTVHNTIQTNGTRLTSAWLGFLKKNRFSVGISLDGPPELHDLERKDTRGRATFERVLGGIRSLQEYSVPFSVLMVVTKNALDIGPDRIFDFFLQNGIREYALIAATPSNQPDAIPGTPAEHYVNPLQMNAFLIRLFDRWLEHGDRGIRIRELEGIYSSLVHKQVEICTLVGGCLGNYFMVEPNGEIAHCDLFVGDKRYTLGNILEFDFGEFRVSTKMRLLQEENHRALQAMFNCPEFRICNGWCPHERYLSMRHNTLHQQSCCGLRDLIRHVRSRLIEEMNENDKIFISEFA